MRYLILCILWGVLVNAQTKKISHKSHNGSNNTFAIAIEKNLFDIKASNLGDVPIEWIKNAQLDSVIYVCEDTQIMVTSEVCQVYDRRFININKEAEETVWREGADTVRNHPLFSKKHALDSIKKVLKEQYYFNNDIDEVIFKGYDNDEPINFMKKAEKKTTVSENDSQPQPKLGSIGFLLLLAVFGSLFYYSIRTKKVN